MTTPKRLSEIVLLTALTLALTCAGCTSTSAAQPRWQSPLHQAHDLVGKIWLAGQDRFIARDELLIYLQQSPMLLMGEKHDNPDHHRLRLALLHDVLLPDGRSQVVLEMMQQAQQAQIDALTTTAPPADRTTLASELAWDNEGWPWHFYGPAVMLALERDAGLRAGNINSSDVMQIYRDTDADSKRQPLGAEQLAQLERDIDSSHCDMLPPDQFPAMVRVQQARDQAMADALRSGPDAVEQRILLAGNYHIRHDLGVPNYLDEDTTPKPFSVAFLEVDPGRSSPEEYLQQFSATLAYDVIWFTPALRQDDYCADMRASAPG